MRRSISQDASGTPTKILQGGKTYLSRPLFEPLTSVAARWREIVDGLPPQVNLLAVSKGHRVELIRELVSLGQLDFGESRLQEALPKQKSLLGDSHALRWHFIGPLQSNKVRAVVKNFDVIHSVSSLALAERVSRIATEEQLCPRVFLQVKFREDPSKGGMTVDQVRELWPIVRCLPNISVIGLMTMTPLGASKQQSKEVFCECRALADELNLLDCSIGMSGDWPEAVEAGGTWLRLGSSLFGEKN